MTLDEEGVEVPSESMFLAFLGAVTGLAFAFGTFGSALWANIHVDGDPAATTSGTLAATLPLVAVCLLPGVVVMAMAHRGTAQRAKANFGWAAVGLMGLLTGGIALVPVAAVLAPWAVFRLLRGLDFGSPPIHFAALIAGPVMIFFFAYSEAHR